MGKRLMARNIKRFCNKVVALIKPEMVMLFGSYSNGRTTSDSDVDIFIIKKTKKRPIQIASYIRRHINYNFPLDIIVMTPKEVEERVNENDPFIMSILEEGQILYEANNKTMDRQS